MLLLLTVTLITPMQQFYTLLSQFSNLQLILLSLPILLAMVLIPVWPLLYRVLLLMRTKEQPEILYFELLFAPSVLQVQNEEGTSEVHTLGAEPEYILSGSSATLVWEVKGASRVDLDPIGKSLKGNATDIIISKKNREFTLTVHGLNSSVSHTIVLPPEMIKTLETEKLSENTDLATFEHGTNTNTLLSKLPKTIELKKIKPKTLLNSRKQRKDSIIMKFNYSLKKYSQK